MILCYSNIDASYELTNDLAFKAILEKDALASQPTVSRFFNRMDEDTLNQFLAIGRVLRKRIYRIQIPEAIILDLDSTLLEAYGKQEGRVFNYHYQSNGYHPLFCYDGITSDLIKIQLRDGTWYSYTRVGDFLQPIIEEYLTDYPSDSCFVVIAALRHPDYINSAKKTALVMLSGSKEMQRCEMKLLSLLTNLMKPSGKTRGKSRKTR